MLFISIFRSTSTQPCRNGICKWFPTQRWFWRFKLFFSYLFLFLGEINIFQFSSLTELQKDWHHLVLNLEKVQWKLIICCWWIIVESISKKKLAFQIILAISSIYYLWALHSDYLHVICAKCEKISYKM